MSPATRKRPGRPRSQKRCRREQQILQTVHLNAVHVYIIGTGASAAGAVVGSASRPVSTTEE